HSAPPALASLPQNSLLNCKGIPNQKIDPIANCRLQERRFLVAAPLARKKRGVRQPEAPAAANCRRRISALYSPDARTPGTSPSCPSGPLPSEDPHQAPPARP